MSRRQRKKELEAKLTLQQKKAAMLVVEREMSDTDKRKTFDEIAKEVGISVDGLYKWRKKNPDFIEYVNIIADEFLESERAFVYRQLMKLIGGPQPSVKGIDLYFRRHGLLTDRQIVEQAQPEETKSNEDIKREIAELDNVLSEDDEK